MTQTTKLIVEPEFLPIYERCKPYTMVDVVKLNGLYKGMLHIMSNQVPGALVECGVWKGGCCMLMALTAMAHGQGNRDIYLYDTFSGMSEPREDDIKQSGEPAAPEWRQKQTQTHNEWCFADLQSVKANVATTNYNPAHLHFVPGKVENTIPATIPADIALLRLDTDWYESTYHELVHLWPRLRPNGIVIFDDYFYWQGQRKATQRYFNELGMNLKLFHTTTGAMGVKPAEAPAPPVPAAIAG